MYIKLYEFNLLKEMSNISPNKTGLVDIVIWVGMKNPKHGHRIKVSNLKNKGVKDKGGDDFSIRINDLKIDGVCKLNKNEINLIFDFININKSIIIDYSNGVISTYDLLKNIKKI
jgi:hypothetical protein